MADNATGTTPQPIKIELGDGTVVTGATEAEALANFQKIANDKAAYINTLKQEKQALETETQRYRREEQERQAALRRAQTNTGGYSQEKYVELLNQDARLAADYVDSFRLGIEDPTQVGPTIRAWGQKTENLERQTIAVDFYNRHQDFPMEQESAAKLDKRILELTAQGHPFSPLTLDMAYNSLVGEGAIKPQTKQKEDDTPNPGLRGGGAGATNLEADEIAKAEAMSTADLAKLLASKGMPVQ